MRTSNTFIRALAFGLCWLAFCGQCFSTSDSSDSRSQSSSSSSPSDEPSSSGSEHDVGQSGSQSLPAQPVRRVQPIRHARPAQQERPHPQVLTGQRSQPLQGIQQSQQPGPSWRAGQVQGPSSHLESEYAFWQARPGHQGESSSSHGPVAPSQADLAHLQPRQRYRTVQGQPLTLYERQMLADMQSRIAQGHLDGARDRSSGVVSMPLVSLPRQAEPFMPANAQPSGSATQSGTLQSPPHPSDPGPINDGGHSSPLRQHSHASQENIPSPASRSLTDHLESRGVVLADPNWRPHAPSQPSALRRHIASFRFPHKTKHLFPSGTTGRANFMRIVDKGGGSVRLATDPDLAAKLSTTLLSGQRLLASKGMWKTMGMRIIFAKNHQIAYALAEAKTLKDAFPGISESDRARLPDDQAALVQIERDGRQHHFSLFSVFDSSMFRRFRD